MARSSDWLAPADPSWRKRVIGLGDGFERAPVDERGARLQ